MTITAPHWEEERRPLRQQYWQRLYHHEWKEVITLADVEKFTDEGVAMILKHSDRLLKNDANKDIVKAKSDFNYSVPIDTKGMNPKEYYQDLVGNSYLYGRGTLREKEAVTCCGWVITLPKSVSAYSSIERTKLERLNPQAENEFFEGVTRFVADRYGSVFYNRVHFDEGGQPHIHIYFVPLTKLDHDQVHYKTARTHTEVRTESGRYEYAYRFKLQNGEKIALKNYARMSDYFDTKISGADVLNKAELKHFHKDLMEYAVRHNIPGADSLYTGKTEGKNISVKAMKEFTKVTGLSLEEIREHPIDQEVLRSLIKDADIRPADRHVIERINSDSIIARLEEKVSSQERIIEDLTQKLHSVEPVHEWGKSEGWGTSNATWGTDYEVEEKLW